MTLLERAARDFAVKFTTTRAGEPRGFREALLPLIADQSRFNDLNALDSQTLLRLRASLLTRISDSVDIMGPAALDPELANALIAHFMPAGTSISSHCPYCLSPRASDHHECPFLQYGTI